MSAKNPEDRTAYEAAAEHGITIEPDHGDSLHRRRITVPGEGRVLWHCSDLWDHVRKLEGR